MPPPRPAPRAPLAALALGAALAASCAALVDPDRFDFDPAGEAGRAAAPPTGLYRDLSFDMVQWVPHLNQLVGFRLVDSNNLVVWRGVIAPLTDLAPIDRLYARSAVPRAAGDDLTYRLEFYADNDRSGGYSGLPNAAGPGDHAWRLNPLQDFPEEGAAEDDVVRVTYAHNTNFTEINTLRGAPLVPSDAGGTASFRLRGLEPFVGKMLEARVVEAFSGRMVGLYRHSALRAPTADFALPGVILEVGAEYQIDLYVDRNGDRSYQNPAAPDGDDGYRFTVVSTPEGLVLDADLAATPDRGVDVGSFDGP